MLESVLAICVSLATIITSVALGVRWLVKHYFDEIKKEIKKVEPVGTGNSSTDGEACRTHPNRFQDSEEERNTQTIVGCQESVGKS